MEDYCWKMKQARVTEKQLEVQRFSLYNARKLVKDEFTDNIDKYDQQVLAMRKLVQWDFMDIDYYPYFDNKKISNYLIHREMAEMKEVYLKPMMWGIMELVAKAMTMPLDVTLDPIDPETFEIMRPDDYEEELNRLERESERKRMSAIIRVKLLRTKLKYFGFNEFCPFMESCVEHYSGMDMLYQEFRLDIVTTCNRENIWNHEMDEDFTMEMGDPYVCITAMKYDIHDIHKLTGWNKDEMIDQGIRHVEAYGNYWWPSEWEVLAILMIEKYGAFMTAIMLMGSPVVWESIPCMEQYSGIYDWLTISDIKYKLPFIQGTSYTNRYMKWHYIQTRPTIKG